MKKIKSNKKRVMYVISFSIIGIILNTILNIYIDFSFNFQSCINCLSSKMISGGKEYIFNVVPNKGIELIKDILYVKGFSSSINVIKIVILLFLLVIVFKLIYDNKYKLSKLSIVYYTFLLIGIFGNFIGYKYLILFDNIIFGLSDILFIVGIMLLIFDFLRNRKLCKK